MKIYSFICLFLLTGPFFIHGDIKYEFSLYEEFPELVALEKDFDRFWKDTARRKSTNDVVLENYMNEEYVNSQFRKDLSIIEKYVKFSKSDELGRWFRKLKKNLRSGSLRFADFKYAQEILIDYYNLLSLTELFIEDYQLEFLFKEWKQKETLRNMPIISLRALLHRLRVIEPMKFTIQESERELLVVYIHGHDDIRGAGKRSASRLFYKPLKEARSKGFLKMSVDHLTQWYSTREISIKNIIEAYLSGIAIFGVTQDIELVDGYRYLPRLFNNHDKAHNALISSTPNIFAPEGHDSPHSRAILKKKLEPYLRTYKRDILELEKDSVLKQIGFFFFWMQAVHERGYLFSLSERQYEIERAFLLKGRSPLSNENFFGKRSIWGISFEGIDKISKEEGLLILGHANEYRKKIISEIQFNRCKNHLGLKEKR